MTVPSATTLIPLLVVSLLGVVLAGLGYRLVAHLLRWTGWIGGGAVGGVAGWQLLPQFVPGLTPNQRLLWTGGLFVGGALAGRIVLPVATRLAAVITGFFSTAGAVGVFFLGDPIFNLFSTIDPSTAPIATARTLATNLEQLVIAQGIETLILILAAGLVGAIVATRYHTELIAGGITLAGAFFLGIVLPLWQTVLTGTATLGVDVGTVSVIWTGVALVAGVLVQAIDHHGDRLFDDSSVLES
ncbi:hypothetical protein [Halorubrum sp. N11]|uniref:hypothetical protein n=1 Tax=Halorubrum sp. N11 TaxID=3402276 RepID=UPI003EBDBF97